MKRFLILVAVLMGICGIAFVPSVTASATYHGTFTAGVGLNSDLGRVMLSPSGRWNVNLGARGTELTGQLSVFHQPCDGQPQPCPFQALDLKYVVWEAGSWRGDSYLVDGSITGGAVEFLFHLRLDTATGDLALRIDIDGCPYGWTSWLIEGTATT